MPKMLPISMLCTISGVECMFKKLFAVFFAVSVVILFAEIQTYSDEDIKLFTWRGVEVTEFPYVIKEYPKGMSVIVDGKDILAGEKVQGVSYKGGTLILENADISEDIRVGGIEKLKVSLTGDNKVNRIVFGGTSVTVIGDGTLTTEHFGSNKRVYFSDTSLTISEKARVYGKKDYENDTELNSPLRFGSVTVKDNGWLAAADIKTYNLKLRDNAYVNASHCSSIDYLTLSGNSIMEVITDYEDYSKLEMDYTLGRCLYCVTCTDISDNAQLTVVCNDTPVYGMYCYGGHNGRITVSDNGMFYITGSSGYGVYLDNSADGTLEMNDDSRVTIDGFDVGLIAQRVDINGGTLDISSNICAMQIDDIISPYSIFETVLSINGDVISQSCDWKVTDYTEEENEQYGWCYDILRSADTGEPLKDFSITVAQKEDNTG